MSTSYTPIFHYPPPGAAPYLGEDADGKIVKDLRTLPPEQYGGWWPTFFPSTIGFLVTAAGGRVNVMTVSCLTVCCARPFMIGMPIFTQGDSPRGDGPRFSLDLLQQNPEFTVNIGCIDKSLTKRAIICGAFTGRDGTDKIAKAGFTALPSRSVAPPILKQCQLNLECRVHTSLALGSHTWVVGKVEVTYLDRKIASGEETIVWRSMPELLRQNDHSTPPEQS